MSTCQTWATSSQFRHPWLEPTTMKRKRRETMCDNSDLPPPSTKRRRRYSTIEDGFAYLSLNGNSAPYYGNHAPDTVSVEEIPAPVPMDAEMSYYPSYPSQPAYTVEEPTIPEINMKTPSWFEPERDRIVITDLDSFTQSDDEDEQPSMAVNTVLLEKIRAKVVDESANPLLQATSQALVLFRPPPWAGAMNEEAKREEVTKAHKESKLHRQVDMRFDEEDMAMEVEL